MVADLIKLTIRCKYGLLKRVASVNECLLDMIACLDVAIDNADAYYDNDRENYDIMRKIPSTGGMVYAFDDIRNIDQAASKCISIVEDDNQNI